MYSFFWLIIRRVALIIPSAGVKIINVLIRAAQQMRFINHHGAIHAHSLCALLSISEAPVSETILNVHLVSCPSLGEVGDLRGVGEVTGA